MVTDIVDWKFYKIFIWTIQLFVNVFVVLRTYKFLIFFSFFLPERRQNFDFLETSCEVEDGAKKQMPNGMIFILYWRKVYENRIPISH